jgi:hypothetical protein
LARLQRMNDKGAVYMLEAILATVLLISVLAYMNANITAPTYGEHDSLKPLADDIINILMYRNNTVEAPGLIHVMSSSEEWKNDSAVMGTCIKAMLPESVHYHFQSPYGELGEIPPTDVQSYSRPFITYCEEDEKMEECELILWR